MLDTGYLILYSKKNRSANSEELTEAKNYL
jgi:hypothetical protein